LKRQPYARPAKRIEMCSSLLWAHPRLRRGPGFPLQ
jgi:hypothetical protein